MSWLTFFERPEDPGRCEFDATARHAMLNGAPVRVTARSVIHEGEFASISVGHFNEGRVALTGFTLVVERLERIPEVRNFRAADIERIEVEA